MQLIDVINKRVSIRKFKDIDISDDLIIDIINCARLSPSAKNRQPWRFKILRGKEKEDISNMLLNWYDDLSEDEIKDKKLFHVLNSANIIKNAPVIILIFRINSDQYRECDIMSIGSAIEHMCLRCTDLELGSLWIADILHVKDDVNKYLNIDDMELFSILAVGFSDEEPINRPRKNIDELIR